MRIPLSRKYLYKICIEDYGQTVPIYQQLTFSFQYKMSQDNYCDVSLRIKPLHCVTKLSSQIYQASKRDSSPPAAFSLAKMRHDRLWSVRTFQHRLINCNKAGWHIRWQWQPWGERRGLGFPARARVEFEPSSRCAPETCSGTHLDAHLLWLIACFAQCIHFIISFKWAKTTRIRALSRAVMRGKMKGGNMSWIYCVCKRSGFLKSLLIFFSVTINIWPLSTTTDNQLPPILSAHAPVPQPFYPLEPQ